MSLRTKLVAAFGAVAVVTLVASTVGYWQAQRLASALYEVGAVRLPSIQGLAAIRDAMTALESVERTLLLPGLGPAAVEAERARDAAAWASADAGWRLYAPLPQTGEEARTWRSFVPAWTAWRSDHADLVAQAVASHRSGDPNALARAREHRSSTTEALRSQASTLLDSLLQINDRVATEARARSVSSLEDRRFVERVMLVTAIVAVIVTIVLGLLMGGVIGRPIERMAQAVSRIAGGDLSTRVDVRSDDEIGRMAEAVNGLVTSLGNSEASLRVLSDHLPGGLVYQMARELDGTMRMLYVSAGIERLLGVSRDAAMRDSAAIYERMLDEDRATVKAAETASAADLSVFNVVARMRRSDGAVRWMQFSSSPRRLADGRVVWDGLQIDITDRRRAEDDLRRVNRALRTITSGSQALVRAGSEEQLLRDMCRAVVSETGYRLAWVGFRVDDEAQTVQPMAHAGFEGGFFRQVALTWAERGTGLGPTGTAIRTGQPAVCRDFLTDPALAPWREEALTRGYRSAAGLPLMSDGRTFGSLTVYADEADAFDAAEIRLLKETADDLAYGIQSLRARTRRAQAEDALRQSQSRLFLAMEMAKLAYWEYDVAADRFTFDEHFYALMRTTTAEQGGPHMSAAEYVRRFVPAEEADVVSGEMKRAIAADDPHYSRQLEHRFVRADGSEGTLLVRFAVKHDDTGRVERTYGANQDISEIRELEEQFRHAQRMEAVGQLAGGVAHDFNNLLTVITGYSDLLQSTLPADDPARDLIDEIRRAGKRSASLTRQLLVFSRKQIVSPTVLDLNETVRDTERMLRRLIGEDVHLATNLEEPLGRIVADPGLLEQVLLNLAVNSRDAMPQGGRLTIETAQVTLQGSDLDRRPTLRPGRHVVLAVRDTGDGMNPDVARRIFEPFFTTKAPGKGTGLGLAVVHGIVRQSDGHIEVESEPGAGTTFRILLPCVDRPVDEPAAAVGVDAVPRGTGVVLLVEDDSAVRSLSRRILQRCGYTVLEAIDGDDALRVCQIRHEPIDLLVTDVVMPGLGGRLAAERVLAMHPEMRVLYLSGYTDDAMMRHGIQEHQVNFLQKPFSPGALAQKVQQVLAG